MLGNFPKNTFSFFLMMLSEEKTTIIIGGILLCDREVPLLHLMFVPRYDREKRPEGPG
jgi:hypothetical protein